MKKLSAPLKAQTSGEYEKLAVYFVYRYFLKAVRDFDLLSKIKAMIVFVFAAGDNMDRIYDDSYLSDIFSDTSMLALLEWTL